jgi:hypothetical protein
MIDLEKYGFVLEHKLVDSVIYKLPHTELRVYFNGERYSFYTYMDDSRIDRLYMVKLDTNEDLEFVLNNVRDIESDVIAHSFYETNQ